MSEPFHLTVRLPEALRDGIGAVLHVDTPVSTVGELMDILIQRVPAFSDDETIYNVAVNGAMLLHAEKAAPLASGDEVEIVVAFAGG